MSKVRKDGVSLGYCTMHFAAVSSAQWAARRAGIPVGTVRRASNGYWTEWDGHRWRYEHELIGERLLGRKLRDNETITHITGSGDNSVMNLQLCTSVPLSVAASIAGGEKPG